MAQIETNSTPEIAQGPAPESRRNPWLFVPILYFLQGVPVMIVQGMSGTMYTKLGIGVAALGLWTSLLKLPWLFKPLWAPFVELNWTKRKWVLAMQAFMVVALAASAFTIQQPSFFALSLTVFMLVAFISSTHDIAADGFYLLALDKSKQAFFVGIRSACFRLGSLFATFGLVYLAGDIEETTGNIPHSWYVALLAAAGVYAFFAILDAFALPKPAADIPGKTFDGAGTAKFFEAFISFFKQEKILWVLAFILFFRFGESMISTMAAPFLLQKPEVGGMGISTKAQGTIGGAVGVISLTVGGILGGWLISKYGIKKTVWPMVLSLNIPNLAYIWLATARPASHIDQALKGAPENLALFSGEWFAHSGNVLAAAFTDPIGIVVAFDQFGYGFGLSAYLVYLMYVAQGSRFETASYAVATGLMALGAMLAGALSGYIAAAMQASYGPNAFLMFFWWVMLFTVPGMISLFFIPMTKQDIRVTQVEID